MEQDKLICEEGHNNCDHDDYENMCDECQVEQKEAWQNKGADTYD